MRLHWNLLVAVLTVLPVTALLAVGAHAQNPQAGPPAGAEANLQGPKLRLAVMDLSATALKNPPPAAANLSGTANLPPATDVARGLTEMLTTALVGNGHFVVIERAALDKITAEQDLATGGKVNAATAPGAGKLLGANAIILGDITEFSYSQSGFGGTLAGLHGLGSKLGKQKVTAQVTIHLRVVAAATGEILAAQRGEGKATMSNVSADVLKGSQNFKAAVEHDTPLGEAARQALDRAVEAIDASLKNMSWSARVIDVREGKVYINAGAQDGLHSGQEFEVFHPGEVLIDPDTGRSLGAPDSPLGSVAVDSAQEKYSVARMTSGSGMQRGDVVRLKAAKP